jgi:hypothetical protein
MIFILTPCTRPENLETIYASIEKTIGKNYFWKWMICFDTSVVKFQTVNYWKEHFSFDSRVDVFHEFEGLSVVGNAQRNHLLRKLIGKASPLDYVYFLDDDNVVHYKLPRIIKVMDSMRKCRMAVFGQEFIDGTQRLRPNADNIVVDQIDTACVVFQYVTIEGKFWELAFYNADGRFIQRVYNEYKEQTYINSNSYCYYNALRNDNN